MRRCILTFIIISVLSLFLLSEDDDLLRIECSISPKRLSRGEVGKVILKLSVKEGITISPQPTFIIEFSPNRELVFPKNFFTASDLEIDVLEDKGDECLSLMKPIEIPFTVNLEATRGRHLLEGKIKYFASNKTEGWCLKNSSKFSVSFSTRQSIIKKK